MNNNARMDADGVVIEICSDAAVKTHNPDLAGEFVGCPEWVKPNDTYIDGNWIAAPPAPPAPVLIPKMTPMTLYLAFTPNERVRIKKSVDAMVNDFWDTFKIQLDQGHMIDPNFPSLVESVTHLAGPVGVLTSPDRIAQILNGEPQ